MSFIAKLQRAREVIAQQARLSLRALGRELESSGDELDELVAELTEVQQVARLDGAVLIWCGGDPVAASPSVVTPPVARTPASYTPKHLADKILQSRAAIEGERKQVTVMFADIQGSMQLAIRLDPEVWHQILDRYFAILSDAVHRFEGTVNQYTGDGIMALFGAPIAHEDHAQRACYAALEARDRLQHFTNELRLAQGLDFNVRIALNSGEVVVGRIGDDLRMDYTAQGATVGTTQRIEQITAPGKVYLSETTQRYVNGYFQLHDLGSAELKGIAGPTRIFELEAAGRARSRLDVSVTRGLSRFVGRAREMQTLDTALSNANAGHGQVVGVVGDPGQGKSRLCFEFVEACRARGISVFEGHCPAHGKNVPLLPILEIFRQYFGITQEDRAETARQKIAGVLVLLDPALQDSLGLIFEFMGVADPERPSPTVDAETKQRQMFGLLHRMYQAHDRTGKVVVTLIDDVHWIDPSSDTFVAQMVSATEGKRSLLLLNFRPEYVAAFSTMPHYQQLPLVPLGEDATRELVQSLIGNDASVDALTTRIVQWTLGNPFYTEELVLSLIDSGQLVGSPERYLLAGDSAALALPASVHDVLAARIDRLPEEAKRLLQTAAVIGKSFNGPMLEAISDLPEANRVLALERLKAGSFIHETALYPIFEYAFKHPLTHEVAYHSQLTARRKVLHAKVAQALEKQAGSNLNELTALLAHHWEEAGEPAQAIIWYRRAAVWTSATHAAAAQRYWQRIRTLTDELPPEPSTFAMGAEACARILNLGFQLDGSLEIAKQIFADGLRLAGLANNLGLQAQLNASYAINIGVAYGDAAAYLGYAGYAVQLADQSQDPEVQAIAYLYRTSALYWSGDSSASLTVVKELFERLKHDVHFGVETTGFSPYISGLLLAGFACTNLGQFEDAHVYLNQGEQLSLSHKSGEIAAWMAWGKCLLAITQGFPEVARQQVETLAARSQMLGTRSLDLWISSAAGASECANEQWHPAVEITQEARSQGHDRYRMRLYSPLVLGHLAEALLALNDIEQACEQAEEAVAFCEANALRWCTTPWRILARIRIAQGDAVGARAAIDNTQTVITETGALAHQGLLHECRAEFAKKFGHTWNYNEELREAHRLHVALGADGHAARLAGQL